MFQACRGDETDRGTLPEIEESSFYGDDSSLSPGAAGSGGMPRKRRMHGTDRDTIPFGGMTEVRKKKSKSQYALLKMHSTCKKWKKVDLFFFFFFDRSTRLAPLGRT